MAFELKHRNILLISPEPWEHLHVSKHHYAIHLARRGNNLFFLNPPSQTTAIKETGLKGLKSIDYTGFLKGMRFLPDTIQRWLTKRKWKELVQRAGVDFDIIWSFDNSVFYHFEALPKSVLKISHIVDLNQNFQTKQAASSADICFYNSEFIGRKIRQFNDSSFFINHGYSEVQIADKTYLVPESSGIKVGYAGNLDIKYLDWELIRTCVKSYPLIQFYFAGYCKNEETLEWLENTSNVSYLGILGQPQLKSFYDQMAILMITYQADLYQEQLANPHKFLEYLGTGKPIVATYTAQYHDMSGLCYMSLKNDQWLDIFDFVQSQLGECNQQNLIQMRKSMAFANTYKKQLDRIENLLNNIQK
jgi:hypothetical protein